MPHTYSNMSVASKRQKRKNAGVAHPRYEARAAQRKGAQTGCSQSSHIAVNEGLAYERLPDI